MRVALFALFVFAAYGSISAFRYPARAYGFNPYANAPTKQKEEAQARQLFWAIRNFLTANTQRNTQVETLFSLVDVTCTKSTSRTCRNGEAPFPQRAALPDILNGEKSKVQEDDNEQFPVAPTTVQQVEATRLPTRGGRASDIEYFLNPRSYVDQLRDIQSAFYIDPYNPLPFSFRDSYALPADGQRQSSNRGRPQMPLSTMFRVNMVTETPICSTVGPMPQCPNC